MNGRLAKPTFNVRYGWVITPYCKLWAWWRHQMETFSALLAICAENSPVPGEFPTQRPMTRNFDVYFDLRPNKRLSKQSWGWWFETPLRPFWRHRNVILVKESAVFDQSLEKCRMRQKHSEYVFNLKRKTMHACMCRYLRRRIHASIK